LTCQGREQTKANQKVQGEHDALFAKHFSFATEAKLLLGRKG
jgi:hypothetical protein